MSRVNIRICSLIVHGSRVFAGEAFGAALQREIGQRIGDDRGSALAGRFRSEPGETSTPNAGTQDGTPFESAAAAHVAGRLMR